MKNRSRGALFCLTVLFVCLLVISGSMAESSLETPKTVTVITGTLDSNQKLLEGYIQKEMYSIGEKPSDRKEAGGKALPAADQRLYDKLLADIKKVAGGEKTSTVFSYNVADIYDKTVYTKDDLGIGSVFNKDGTLTQEADKALNSINMDVSPVMDALLFDFPYELYWYDKEAGTAVNSPEINIDEEKFTVTGQLTFSFRVSKDYAKGGQAYECDPKYGNSVKAAVSNAKKILDKYTGKSDKDKLLGYANEICDLVTYNFDALNGASYGNPWQLIWVFDGDESTNVVCEGYSKAFQYLCDMSAFTGNTRVITVSGGLNGEAHMWNIVQMNDGVNYMADITNTDSGSPLLLVKCDSGNYKEGYTILVDGYPFFYQYDNSTLNRYNQEELVLGSKSSEPEPTGTPTPAPKPSSTPTPTPRPTPGPDGEVPINEAYFPDSIFRDYVKKNYDSDKNGWLDKNERSWVTNVFVEEMGVSSLQGVEFFPNLLCLTCYGNKLTELDISQNTELEMLACYENQLTYLDVSHNTALNDLACSNNQLTSLNIDRNTKLVSLSCFDNSLNALDVSHNPLLCYLTCNSNFLTSLDVSKNPTLQSLWCSDNQLSALDLSQNIALEQLMCNNNQITSIDLQNQPALYLLWCEDNKLTSLDISKNPMMAELMVSKNCLTALNTDNNPVLKYVYCYKNNISSLNLSTNTELETLHCAVNPLTTLDVSQNTKLDYISCHDCGLTSLIFGKNDVLSTVYTPKNNLTMIDISHCAKLNQLVLSTEPGYHDGYDPYFLPYGWESANMGASLLIDKDVYVMTGEKPVPATSEEPTNTPTPTPTPAPTKEPEPEPSDKVEAFITRCYSIILGRAPDAGGLKTWYNELTSGRKTASEIIDRFVNSPEYLNKHYNNGESVDILYQAMLGRNADAGGRANWVKKLENGQTLAHVINGFCFSNEFRGLCDSYGIKAGFVNIPNADTTAEGKIKAFVQRCYRIILDREADPSGMQTWYEQLSSGKKAAAEIIDRFVNSPEFSGKNYNSSDSVEILYKAMLGRGSDAAGKANWVGKLDAGQPFAVVINGFCVSKEFTGICASYGIKPGSVTITPLSGVAEEEALSMLAYKAKEPITKKSEDNPTRVEIINPSDTIDMNIGTAVQAVYINEEKAKEFISKCYQCILGRESSKEELDNWISQMTNGTKTADQIARGFLFSNEFKGRSVGNEDLVKILYKVYMNRDADPEGLKTWTEKLNNGTSLKDLLDAFAKTNEFKKVVSEMSR